MVRPYAQMLLAVPSKLWTDNPTMAPACTRSTTVVCSSCFRCSLRQRRQSVKQRPAVEAVPDMLATLCAEGGTVVKGLGGADCRKQRAGSSTAAPVLIQSGLGRDGHGAYAFCRVTPVRVPRPARPAVGAARACRTLALRHRFSVRRRDAGAVCGFTGSVYPAVPDDRVRPAAGGGRPYDRRHTLTAKISVNLKIDQT
jgi:hypothetical protein